MSFQYERDDANRRVLVTFSGDFSMAEGFAVLERNQSENVGGYAVIYDVRGWTGPPSISDLRNFMTKEASNVSPTGQRGPIAILAVDPIMYSMACTYAVLGKPALNIRVFRDRRDADAWLMTESEH